MQFLVNWGYADKYKTRDKNHTAVLKNRAEAQTRRTLLSIKLILPWLYPLISSSVKAFLMIYITIDKNQQRTSKGSLLVFAVWKRSSLKNRRRCGISQSARRAGNSEDDGTDTQRITVSQTCGIHPEQLRAGTDTQPITASQTAYRIKRKRCNPLELHRLSCILLPYQHRTSSLPLLIAYYSNNISIMLSLLLYSFSLLY